MDILKARQRAKEAKAKAAEEKARQAELESDLARTQSEPSSSRSSSPSPSPSTRAPQQPEPEPAAPARRPEPQPGARRTESTTTDTRARGAIKVDPLQEFLAVYDDDDELETVVDDGPEMQPMLEDERRFLSFDLAGEAYAASIMDIREILTVVTLTEVPRAPKEVLGVLSKRGLVMPVCDLAAILGLRASERALQREQRVLVVGDAERVCGLRVDRVRQVVRLAQRAIEDVPPGLGNKNAHMLLGLGRARVDGSEQAQMLILLDVPAVLAHFAETMGIAPEKVAGGTR